MATRSIKTRLEIEGEAQYKQSLKEISSGMSVLKSEMNKVSAEFKGNESSIDALNAKNDVLNRQILTQKDRIEVLKKALSESAQAYGEADSKTQSWQIKLNNAEADLAKLDYQLQENNKAMETASDETEKADTAFQDLSESNKNLSDVLGEVGDKLGVKIPNGVKNALDSFVKMSPTAVLAASGITAIVAAIASAEKKLMEITKESAKRADDIRTQALNTGISAETLQEWDYASQLIDVDVNTLTGSMTKLIQNMGKVKDGNKNLTDTFQQLGVKVKDDVTGELLDAETVFFNVIDALGEMENSTERDSISMEIFGRSAQDLNSLILQGTDVLQDYAKEAHDTSAVMTDEQLEALGAVDDAQQRLLSTQQAVSDQISAVYAPYMSKALEATRDGIKEIGDALVDSGAVDALGSILESFMSMADPIVDLTKEVLPAFGEVLKGIAGTIAWIADTINAGIGFFTYLFDGGERWNTAMGQNPYQASNIQKALYGSDYKTEDWYIKNGYWMPGDNSYAYNNSIDAHASGTDNFRGGMTWVGENGPELVTLPRGSAISTAQESRAAGGDTFIINVTANKVKEFNDLVSMAQNERRLVRMGGTY